MLVSIVLSVHFKCTSISATFQLHESIFGFLQHYFPNTKLGSGNKLFMSICVPVAIMWRA